MRDKSNNSDVSGASPAVGRWESFLPKMVLRVLLVEADDSTRQIITLLLKKCNYKVAAVSDGLQAWELLNGRPQSFDLILTEVELPSISGYPLLTLIMEHEICKNIPVIMMSAQDSVSTVYKCMLKGAADFLVKPLRKNELRNLWQHVWRKQAQSSSGEPMPLEESTAQQKNEVTAETNANNSCDMICIQTNREFIEKGNDAQSSSKSVLDAGGAEVECALGLFTNSNINKPEESKNPAGLNAQDSESVREVIDLIGQFDSYLKRVPRTSVANVAESNIVVPLPELSLSLKRDSSSVSVDEVITEEKNNVAASDLGLDLSLKRDSSSVSVDEVTEEKTMMLNHSESSPFSRYVNRNVQQPQHPLSPASCSQQKDQKRFGGFDIPELEIKEVIKDGVWVETGKPVTEAMEAAKREYYRFRVPPPSVLGQQMREKAAAGQNEVKMDNSANSSFQNLPETFLLPESSSSAKAARAAALEKFRLKRKERCFEKKVRYESRQKLAEKRPRVRGQFVRQGADGSSSPGSTAAE